MQHFSNSHRNAFRGVPVGLFWLAFLTIPLISVSSCWKVRLCSVLVLSEPLYKADVRAMSSQGVRGSRLKGDQPLLWTTCLFKYLQWPQTRQFERGPTTVNHLPLFLCTKIFSMTPKMRQFERGPNLRPLFYTTRYLQRPGKQVETIWKGNKTTVN